MIPYSKQQIDEDDIRAIVDVLRSPWLTTGPKVDEFESKFADFVGARYAVAVSSGTAALHCSALALGIKAGDEVIVPAMTFAATANCVVYQGAIPIFADVEQDNLLIDSQKISDVISKNTRAIIAVDYAGHPCKYQKLKQIAEEFDLFLISDACHSLGGRDQNQNVGTLADATAFSFHPVKPITTGEGGMITTADRSLYERMRIFRNHGITRDHHRRSELDSWYYEMKELGYNYRLTDFQCALGISQLKKLPIGLERRRRIARYYDDCFSGVDEIQLLKKRPESSHAYHLYVLKLNLEQLTVDRAEVFSELRARQIGVNVHYIPVHLHPFYRQRFGTGYGSCPVAEDAYERILSLPLHSGLTDSEVEYVANTTKKVLAGYRRSVRKEIP